MIDLALWAQIIVGCAHGVDPRLIDALAIDESNRNPAAISPLNHNGTRDYGAMQINSANFSRFDLNEQTALDPCRSINAAARHLIADAGPEAVKPATVSALLHAIGQYNPGDPKKTERVVGIMARNANGDARHGGSQKTHHTLTFAGRPASQ